MASTIEYIKKLQQLKKDLVNNLRAKGVSASNKETFSTLIPKVLEIKTTQENKEE